jgi:protein-tyrosine phosphatase
MVRKTKLPLDTAYNIRDLGGYPARGGASTSARLLRGDCFVPMSGADRRTLLDMGVTAVIDLRGESERARLPSGFCNCSSVTYDAIPLIDDAPHGAARRTLPADFTMGDMYTDMLDNARDAVLAVFRRIALAAPSSGRLLFHCTAGKDRTGVIAALLLSLAGVSGEDIVRDYAQTDENLFPVRDILRENSGVPAMLGALTEEFLSAKPRNMEKMLSHMDREYGGSDCYFARAGLTAAERAKVLDMILEGETR